MLTWKWMDTFTQIEHHQRFCYLFSISNLIILNSLQINFTKNFGCGTHFQFYNYNLFEKFHLNLTPKYKTGSSRMMFLNYTPCVSHLTKNVPLLQSSQLPPPGMDCPASFPKPLGETLQMGRESTPAAKKLLISLTAKIPLTKQQFSCNHPMQASFIAAVMLLYRFSHFRLYLHIYHANLDQSMDTNSYLQHDKKN